MYVENQGVQVILPVEEGVDTIREGAGSNSKLRALTETLYGKSNPGCFSMLYLVIEVRLQEDRRVASQILERTGVRTVGESAINNNPHSSLRSISAMITGGESGFEPCELFRLLVLTLQRHCDGGVRLYGYVMSATRQKPNTTSSYTNPKNKKPHSSNGTNNSNDKKLSLDHLTLHSANQSKKILSSIDWGDIAINSSVIEIISSDECIVMCDWISPLVRLDDISVLRGLEQQGKPEQWYRVRLADPVAGDFVGYKLEIIQIRSLLSQFQEDNVGVTVNLHGIAGVGKTRLIKYLFDSINENSPRTQPARVILTHLRREAFIYGYTQAHVLVMQLLGVELSSSTDDLRAQLKASGISPALHLVILELAEIALSEGESRLLAIMPRGFHKAEELRAVTELISYATRSGSLALVIDDCQNVNPNTKSGNSIARLLKAILTTVKTFPLFVLLSTRNSDSFRTCSNYHFNHHSNIPSNRLINSTTNKTSNDAYCDNEFWPKETQTIELNGVNNVASKSIAVNHISNFKSVIEANSLDITIDVERCIEIADGNPRYIRQTVFSTLLSPPSNTQGNGSNDQIVTLSIDSAAGRYHSLCHTQLNNQMQALNAIQTTLIKVIALMGESIPKRLIDNMKQSSSVSFYTRLGWLKNLPDSYRFVHPFIRRGVLASIAPEESKELHRFCAELYSDNNCIAYLIHATQAADHSATNQVLQLASQKLDSFEFEDAQSLVEHALTCTIGKQRITALMIKAESLAALHQVKTAIEVYEQALREVEDRNQRKELFNALASLYKLVLRKPGAREKAFINLELKYGSSEQNRNEHQRKKGLDVTNLQNTDLLETLIKAKKDFEEGDWEKALVTCQLGLTQSQNGQKRVKEAQFSELLARIQREQLEIGCSIGAGVQAIQLAGMTGRLQLELNARLVYTENLLSACSFDSANSALNSGLALAESISAPRYTVLFLSLQAWYFHLTDQQADAFKTINLSISLMHQYALESKAGHRVYAIQTLIFCSKESNSQASANIKNQLGHTIKGLNKPKVQMASQILSKFENLEKESSAFLLPFQSYPQVITAAYYLRDEASLNRHIYSLINRENPNHLLSALTPRQEFFLWQARVAVRIIHGEATINEVNEFNRRACELQIKTACFNLSEF